MCDIRNMYEFDLNTLFNKYKLDHYLKWAQTKYLIKLGQSSQN